MNSGFEGSEPVVEIQIFSVFISASAVTILVSGLNTNQISAGLDNYSIITDSNHVLALPAYLDQNYFGGIEPVTTVAGVEVSEEGK